MEILDNRLDKTASFYHIDSLIKVIIKRLSNYIIKKTRSRLFSRIDQSNNAIVVSNDIDFHIGNKFYQHLLITDQKLNDDYNQRRKSNVTQS